MLEINKTIGTTMVCMLAFCPGLSFLATIGHAADLGDATAHLWEYVEWSLSNASCAGNPFDLSAQVTFVHQDSNEVRSTAMFYDENNTWKFRFTGTRTGTWRFSTESSDPELDGHAGSIHIDSNPDPEIKGFITHVGNRFARMVGQGEVEGFLPMTYMNYHGFSAHDTPFFGLYGAARMEDYMQEALDHGCSGIFSSYVANHWFKYGQAAYSGNTPDNPDPATFRALELMINTSHRKGGYTHIWAWGDESRKWTPNGATGGINGVADRRLQRYIAARLGPLPGWVIGYGFDLHEWVSKAQLQSWVDSMTEHLGWPHLLGTRAYDTSGSLTYDSYSSFDRASEELSTSNRGPGSYAEVVEDINSDQDHPHWYAERHTYLRDGYKLTMEGTRRLMWWQAMAGGVGGWYGFYPTSTWPYPHPERMKTHHLFWKDRFRVDMDVANSLTDGYCLKSADDRYFVFYKEDTLSIQYSLAGMPGAGTVIALDCRKAYKEIPLGQKNPGQHLFRAPHRSDWVIYVNCPSATEKGP